MSIPSLQHKGVSHTTPLGIGKVTWWQGHDIWNTGSGVTGHGIRIRDLGIWINNKRQMDQD